MHRGALVPVGVEGDRRSARFDRVTELAAQRGKQRGHLKALIARGPDRVLDGRAGTRSYGMV